MHLTPGGAHNFPKAVGLSAMHKKIPDSYSKRQGDSPKNSGLSSQQNVSGHYPRTVWKKYYAEYKVYVTGKKY